MHGNVLITCNTKLSKYFSSNQANIELTEDKYENELKHEELAGNFIGFQIVQWLGEWGEGWVEVEKGIGE